MDAATQPSDYLAAGPLIQARIRDLVRDIQRVDELADLLDQLNADSGLHNLTSGRMPAVFVGYDGDLPGDVAGDGAGHVRRQSWLVVLAVANARRQDAGTGVLRSAGPLLTRLIRALSGYAPEGFLPLIPQPAPKPGYRDGVGFFPLMFSTAVAIEGMDDDED